MAPGSLFYRHTQILAFERAIAGNGSGDEEVVGVFSSNGKLIRMFRGFRSVPIWNRDRQSIEHRILTHNHTSDTSFSRSDLMTAAAFQLCEIRVVGMSGVYSMMPGSAGWPGPGVILETYDAIDEYPGFDRAIAAARRGPEDVYLELLKVRSDLNCERLADRLALRYGKAAWPC